MEHVSNITSRQFATRFALRPDRFAWFLGAGASASGRIPTGYDMITDFKASLFCELAGMPRREIDPTDPLWIARINKFLAQQGAIPPVGDPTEYARAFEAVYPSVDDRRAYIAQSVQRGRPSFAHRVLASLLATGKTPCVFTTNFDNLVESAATVARSKVDPAKHKDLVVAALDSADRAERCARESDWPLLAKMHGDFQSVELKNTTDELAAQDARMRSVLAECGKRFALVVVGYSGRDASVMEALGQALGPVAYPGGIYWMTRSNSKLLPAVEAFLEQAGAQGVNANLLLCDTFDELAGDIADAVTFEGALQQHIHEAGPSRLVAPVPLPTNEARNEPILRCSALRVMELPAVARRIAVQKSAPVSEVRDLLKAAAVKASIAVAGKDFAAFGDDAQILSALAPLGAEAAGEISLDPVQESWALGLVYDAFVRALCRGRPLHPRLKSRGHRIIVSSGHPNETGEEKNKRLKALERLRTAYSDPLFGKVPALGFPFAEALDLRLERVEGRWWCVFDAFTNVDLPRPEELLAKDEPRSFRAPNPAADWVRERWVRRYNSIWEKIIAAWSQMLAGEARAYWLDESKGIDAVFQIGEVSAWSRPSHDHPYFHGRTR
jgi:hypothetical protein